MRKRTAAAQHDVAGLRSQALHGERVEGQQSPEGGLTNAESLQRRGGYRSPGEASRGCLLVIEQGEDRRGVVELGDRRERPLGPAHHEQVVVCERHSLRACRHQL